MRSGTAAGYPGLVLYPVCDRTAHWSLAGAGQSAVIDRPADAGDKTLAIGDALVLSTTDERIQPETTQITAGQFALGQYCHI